MFQGGVFSAYILQEGKENMASSAIN